MDYFKENEKLMKKAKGMEEFEEGTHVIRIDYNKYIEEIDYLKHFKTEREANEYMYVANSLDPEKAQKYVKKLSDEEIITMIIKQFDDTEKYGEIQVYATVTYDDNDN